MERTNQRNLAAELLYVDNRLRVLFAWARDHGVNLGYPSENIIHRVMTQGAGAIQQGRPPVGMPDEIAEIDRAMAQLRKLAPRKAEIVEVNYHYGHEPVELRAKRVKLKRATFGNYLRDGQWILFGILAQTANKGF